MRTSHLLLLALSSVIPAALGQTTAPAGQAGPAAPVEAVAPAASSVNDAALPLGEVFASRVSGIEFCPPAGGTLVRQLNSGDVVRFVYPDRGWDLKLKTVRLQKPVPLSLEPDGNLGGGLLQMTAEQLKSSNPSAEVLKQDVLNVGAAQVGFIAARYNSGVDRVLTQQAIFRVDNATFFILQLTTPGKRKEDKGQEQHDDPRELSAARTFEAAIPTVKILDRESLRSEQNERLYRTKELFTDWKKDNEKRVLSALVAEQWLRVIRDGRDAGYLKVTEQPAEHGGHAGVEMLLRSHVEGDARIEAVAKPSVGERLPDLQPAAPVAVGAPARPARLDRVAKLFVTFDRMHEDWTLTTTADDGRLIPVTTTELGNSDKDVRKALDASASKERIKGDQYDPNNPRTFEKEKYTLSVSTYAKVRTGLPVNRELPVFYLPQAMGHLLPRLLPLGEQRTFMFASYVSDQHEVMSRYVDVLREQEVVLEGRRFRAVPVKDRIGVEGSATMHYVTREGRWLGSVNEEQKIVVLPSEETEIRQIWKDAKLPEEPAPAAEQAAGKVR